MSKKGMQVTKRIDVKHTRFFKRYLKRLQKGAWSPHLTKTSSKTIEIKTKKKLQKQSAK